MLSWTPLRRLNDRRGVSKGSGIYLIGVMDPALAEAGADANYYGENYPLSFRPRYVGMTMSRRNGIASRLRAHALGNGNEQIRDFLAADDNAELYYTYSVHEEADFAEVIFLMHQSDDFLDWNNRAELVGAAKRFFFQYGPPAPLMNDDFEPEGQIAEFESKRKLAEDWDALLDANPKYKRIATDRNTPQPPQ